MIIEIYLWIEKQCRSFVSFKILVYIRFTISDITFDLYIKSTQSSLFVILHITPYISKNGLRKP